MNVKNEDNDYKKQLLNMNVTLSTKHIFQHNTSIVCLN